MTQLIFFLALPRDVARFFVTRGIIARAEGTSLVGGSGGVLPQKNFKFGGSEMQQGSFLHEHARPLNKRCVWRLTTGFAFIKMARLKAIIAIILLVRLSECARDLTKCVVCKKKL